MQRRIGLYTVLSVLISIIIYRISFANDTYVDEILFGFSVCSLTFIFFFFVLPSWRRQEEIERSLALLLKNLKINDEGKTGNSKAHHSLDKLSRLFQNCKQTVESLSSGTPFESDMKFEKNDLVHALSELKVHLYNLSNRDNERQWVSESMSSFIDILKTKYKSEAVFYDCILTSLVTLVEANQGGLFVVSENENDKKYLELVACYAYEKKKFIDRKIEIGEGLVGQVYLEGTTLVIKQVPEDYIRITSGLGESLPKFLIIVPLKFDEQTECILELASFHEIPGYKIQFLEKVGESIASAVVSSKTDHRMKNLLADTQSNSEELRAQEEEMRQNMEELQATQEVMARKENELVEMLEQSDKQKFEMGQKILEIEKLTTTNENYKKDVIEILNSIPAKIFLKDKDGNMILCNNEVAKAYNLTIEDLIGTHDNDHFDAEQAKQFRQQELEVITTGLKTYVQEEHLNGQLRFLSTTKMPFYIHHLGETGLLGYQFDVTDSHKRR